MINALNVYLELIAASQKESASVPLGVNIEQLTRSNFKTSILMLKEFNDIADAAEDKISERIVDLEREGI